MGTRRKSFPWVGAALLLGMGEVWLRVAVAQQLAIYLNSGCYAGQTCVDGLCQSSAAYTSSKGCGTNPQVSVSSYASTDCRDNGCGYGGCNDDEITTESTVCFLPPSFQETCCKAIYTYTCRHLLPCRTDPIPSHPPNPPPPPPDGEPKTLPHVFGHGGAWVEHGDDVASNAYIAAVLASEVYESALGVSGLEAFSAAFNSRVTLPLGGLRTWASYLGTSVNFVLIDTPHSHICVFRGSESILDDWLGTNLDSTLPTPTDLFGGAGKGVQLGSGFLNAFSDVKDQFIDNLIKFRNSSSHHNKPLWFSGHSLGGALSSLFAAWTHNKGIRVQGVYTFASPLVGNGAWQHVYPLNNITYRYAVPSDFVPSTPCFFGRDGAVGHLKSLHTCHALLGRRHLHRHLLLEGGNAEGAPPPMDDGPRDEAAAGGQQQQLQQEHQQQQAAAGHTVAGVAAAAGGAETAVGGRRPSGGKRAGAGGSGGRLCGTVASDAATLPELPETWECPEEETEDGRQQTAASGSSSTAKAAAGTAAAVEGGEGSGDGEGGNDGGEDMIDIDVEPRGIFDVGNAVTCVATSCCGFSCSSGEGCYSLPLNLCVVCPQPGYSFAAHSVLDSYIPRLWSCRLSKSEHMKLPAPWEVAKM